MKGGQDGALAIADGKVGIAYIEELRFANYVARLQNKINDTFDYHFKAYMKSAGIAIDPHLFKLKLCAPQNFVKYRKAEIDEKMLGNYSNVKDVKVISERFKLMHFMGMSEDDIQENEVMLKQEKGIPDGGIDSKLDELRMMYDENWIENRPDIKVADSYDDHTAATESPDAKADDEGAGEEEDKDKKGGEGEEKPTGGEVKGGGAPAKPEEGTKSADEVGDELKDVEKL